MPTYEYTCSKCGKTFDCFQSITAEPLKTCPKDKCPNKTWGKGAVKRSISGGAGIIFKGSGFYETDYRSDKYKNAARKEKSVSVPKSLAKDSSTTPAPASTSGTQKPKPTPAS
jgi:putative FmdB family regulatory protein